MKLERFKEKNNKKRSIIVFTICCILLIVGVFFYQSFALFETRENLNFVEGNVEDPGDLYFAYYIDDVLTYDMPSKDSGYTMSSKSNCTNGVTITWDDERWGAFVDYTNYTKGNNSRVKCNLYFEEKKIPPNPTDAVKEYIIAKAKEGTIIEDDGTSDHNLRYIGTDPNNYIDIGDTYQSDIYYGYRTNTYVGTRSIRIYYSESDCKNASIFNDSCTKINSIGNKILWRVVGIMNNIDDGTGAKESRLKITRAETIGSYSWDASDSSVNSGYGVNEWSQADANVILNDYYYNGKDNQTCPYTNTTTPCDFNNIRLSENAKQLIKEAVWNTGSNGDEVLWSEINAKQFYQLERSENTGKICTSGSECNDNITRMPTWTGKIGLTYPSDYGYATSGGSSTMRETCLNTNLSDWNLNGACHANNWLYDSNLIRATMTPTAFSSAGNRYFVTGPIYKKIGSLSIDRAYSVASYFYPTAYLDTNVKITGGDGTQSNPFTISLN